MTMSSSNALHAMEQQIQEQCHMAYHTLLNACPFSHTGTMHLRFRNTLAEIEHASELFPLEIIHSRSPLRLVALGEHGADGPGSFMVMSGERKACVVTSPQITACLVTSDQITARFHVLSSAKDRSRMVHIVDGYEEERSWKMIWLDENNVPLISAGDCSAEHDKKESDYAHENDDTVPSASTIMDAVRDGTRRTEATNTLAMQPFMCYTLLHNQMLGVTFNSTALHYCLFAPASYAHYTDRTLCAVAVASQNVSAYYADKQYSRWICTRDANANLHIFRMHEQKLCQLLSVDTNEFVGLTRMEPITQHSNSNSSSTSNTQLHLHNTARGHGTKRKPLQPLQHLHRTDTNTDNNNDSDERDEFKNDGATSSRKRQAILPSSHHTDITPTPRAAVALHTLHTRYHAPSRSKQYKLSSRSAAPWAAATSTSTLTSVSPPQRKGLQVDSATLSPPRLTLASASTEAMPSTSAKLETAATQPSPTLGVLVYPMAECFVPTWNAVLVLDGELGLCVVTARPTESHRPSHHASTTTTATATTSRLFGRLDVAGLRTGLRAVDDALRFEMRVATLRNVLGDRDSSSTTQLCTIAAYDAKTHYCEWVDQVPLPIANWEAYCMVQERDDIGEMHCPSTKSNRSTRRQQQHPNKENRSDRARLMNTRLYDHHARPYVPMIQTIAIWTAKSDTRHHANLLSSFHATATLSSIPGYRSELFKVPGSNVAAFDVVYPSRHGSFRSVATTEPVAVVIRDAFPIFHGFHLQQVMFDATTGRWILIVRNSSTKNGTTMVIVSQQANFLWHQWNQWLVNVCTPFHISASCVSIIMSYIYPGWKLTSTRSLSPPPAPPPPLLSLSSTAHAANVADDIQSLSSHILPFSPSSVSPYL